MDKRTRDTALYGPVHDPTARRQAEAAGYLAALDVVLADPELADSDRRALGRLRDYYSTRLPAPADPNDRFYTA